MNEMDYFSPEYLIELGSYSLSSGVELSLNLDLDKSASYGVIKVTPKIFETINVNTGDDIAINLGYTGDFKTIFTGVVASIKNDEIIVKDYFYKLNSILINKSFTNCTFFEILKFILNQADVESFDIKEESYPIKNNISIKSLSGIDAIKYIEQRWHIKDSVYYFDNEIFIYNKDHKQSKVTSLKYGENILGLQQILSGFWEIETVLIPRIKIRDKIKIYHPKLIGEFNINKVNFTINEYGFIRTKIMVRSD